VAATARRAPDRCRGRPGTGAVPFTRSSSATDHLRQPAENGPRRWSWASMAGNLGRDTRCSGTDTSGQSAGLATRPGTRSLRAGLAGSGHNAEDRTDRARQDEEDDPWSALGLGLQRHVDRDADGVGRLGGGGGALGTRKQGPGLNDGSLVDGQCFDEPLVLAQTHERPHAVAAQATRVDRLGNEVMAERACRSNPAGDGSGSAPRPGETEQTIRPGDGRCVMVSVACVVGGVVYRS
jgi:hypothetical protein